jgi:hypothetical protein
MVGDGERLTEAFELVVTARGPRMLTLPVYGSNYGWSSGSPYTSLVEAYSIRPSQFEQVAGAFGIAEGNLDGDCMKSAGKAR